MALKLIGGRRRSSVSEHELKELNIARDELQALRQEYSEYKRLSEQRFRNLEAELEDGEATIAVTKTNLISVTEENDRLENTLRVELANENRKSQDFERYLQKRGLATASDSELLVAERRKSGELQRALALALEDSAEQRRARGESEGDGGHIVHELRNVLGAALVDGVDDATQTSPHRFTTYDSDIACSGDGFPPVCGPSANLHVADVDGLSSRSASHASTPRALDSELQEAQCDETFILPGSVELQARVALLEKQLVDKDNAVHRLRQEASPGQGGSSPSSPDLRSRLESLEQQLLSMDQELLDKDQELLRKDQDLLTLVRQHDELQSAGASTAGAAASSAGLVRPHVDADRVFLAKARYEEGAPHFVLGLGEFVWQIEDDYDDRWDVIENSREYIRILARALLTLSYSRNGCDIVIGMPSVKVAPQLGVRSLMEALPPSEPLPSAHLADGVELVD